MCEKVNAIYGDGIGRPEVVCVLGGSDIVLREIYRTARHSGACMIPEVQPFWIEDLTKINIEPLKRKEGLKELENFRNKMLGSF